MASTLTVDNIVGATSASNIHIPGHVIGFAQANDNTQQVITSSSFVSLGLTVSYTAKKANSLIKVEYHLPSEIYDSGANNEVIGETALYLDGSNVGASFQTINTSQNVLRSGSPVYSKYIQTAGDIASHTWTVYARASSGIENFTCFRYGLAGYITLMEIAQ
jgi:hypothetical protein